MVVAVAIAIAPLILNQFLFQNVDSIPLSEVGAPYQLVPGSIYDGDTLRVTDGSQEIKVRLCGIDAPERRTTDAGALRDDQRSRTSG